MELTPEEKEQILDMIGKLEKGKKKIVLASIEAFGRWLANVLYSIYLKIKDALQALWQSIGDFFS